MSKLLLWILGFWEHICDFQLLKSYDIFFWRKFNKFVLVPDNGNIVMRGQIMGKEQVTVRFVKTG